VGPDDRLGVKTYPNAGSKGTANGGSPRFPEVAEATAEAGRSVIRPSDVQDRAGRHIAGLVGGEAAYAASGAAAGVAIAVAARMSGRQWAPPAATRPGVAGAAPRDGRHNPLAGTTLEHERMTCG
jgi:hypothetical protein